MGTPTAGLRERKKQQTRQAISDHATRLFIEQGFEQVTIAQIAAAAQVAKMTVTNYFPRKEDLALDIHEEFVHSLARTVTERATGESALTALRRAYRTAAQRHDPITGFAGADFTRMITNSATLTARLRELHEQREDALAAALAETTHAPPDDITPRAAAAQFGALHRVLFAEAQRHTLAGRNADEIATALTTAAQTAFDLLEPALGDYATKDP
jgi:AcrR family transcriptional regulator